MLKKIKLLLLLFILSLFLLNSCSIKKEKIFKESFAFNTFYSIIAYDYDNKENAIKTLNNTIKMINDYELLFSKTNKDSELYKINHLELDLENASEELKNLINISFLYKEQTSNAFDITIGSLIDLWDINNRKTLPSNKDIENSRNIIQYDLGGIAKGYVSEKIKEYLIENNIYSCIINFGGNVVCIGSKENNQDFIIGIKMPFDESKIIDTIKVKNQSVVTAGIYERYFKIDGDDKIYHHIIDPSTSYPVDNNLYSVTICMDNAMIADVLSTTCIIKGLEESNSFLNNFSKKNNINIIAIFIDKKLNIIKEEY
ncbi:MAG: FAD:protein FMN transferase [Eubacteriales bacterium]|nr:FAD:protein FMN transferase [Eubacteriales bacterium]